MAGSAQVGHGKRRSGQDRDDDQQQRAEANADPATDPTAEEAGRKDRPRIARLYADLTSQIHQITGTMQNQFNVPGQGPNAAHQRLLELRNQVHDASPSD